MKVSHKVLENIMIGSKLQYIKKCEIHDTIDGLILGKYYSVLDVRSLSFADMVYIRDEEGFNKWYFLNQFDLTPFS